MKIKSIIVTLFYTAVMTLSGCGGGGGGGTGGATFPTVTPAPTTVLSGLASKGPIAGGTVTAYPISFGVMDTASPLGQAQTDGAGNYTLDIGYYQGPVVLEITGGSFTDEATGATVPLGTPLRAMLSNAATTQVTAAVTPLTELAFRRAKGIGTGTLTPATMGEANAGIAAAFGLTDIISTLPAEGATGIAQRKYGAACGCISQLVNNNKTAGETTDAALTRLLTLLGNEQETTGGFSLDTIAMINGAMATYNTGGLMTPIPTPTRGLLKIGTALAPGVTAIATNAIGGLDMTVNLPAGVTVNADAVTGETATGAVAASGGAAVGSNLAAAKFIPGAAAGAPSRLHIVMANSQGFPLGECLTIQFGLTAGTVFPPAGTFSVTGVAAKALDGTGLTGITAAPLSVAAGTGGVTNTPAVAPLVLTTGTVTGFGSVFVDGVEFQTDATTHRRRLDLSSADLPGDDRSIFSVGMVVSVQHRQGSSKATKVEFVNNLEGPVTHATATGCTILGIPVNFGANTVIKPDSSALVDGAIAAVSGVPDASGAIPATFIDVKPAASTNEFELKGFVSSLDTANKTFSIGAGQGSTSTKSVSFATAVIDSSIAGGLADGLFVEVKTDLDGCSDSIKPIKATTVKAGTKSRIEPELEL